MPAKTLSSLSETFNSPKRWMARFDKRWAKLEAKYGYQRAWAILIGDLETVELPASKRAGYRKWRKHR